MKAMSVRTLSFVPALLALSLAPACAHQQMRAQAAALATAAGTLERETAEFTAARAAVVQLRQRNLVERRQQIAEQGQFNARTVHFWKIASDPERQKRLALYDGLVAAGTAAAAVQDRPYEWEESVLARSHAITIDRAALHRFVQQLVVLSLPPRFLDSARFYIEYGAVVGQQVDAGLKDVRETVAGAAAAQATGDSGGSGDAPTRPDGPGDRQPTDPGRQPPDDSPKPGDPRPSDVLTIPRGGKPPP
jgi:hypothetical protein